MVTNTGWMGSNPFYLVISLPDMNVGIDLDESQWATKYADYLRVPSNWLLIHKASGAEVLGMIVRDGDQPYYTARHIGVVGGTGGNEVIAYGIGKKHPDGSTERMWVMPNGMVCLGDDAEDIGIRMVHSLGPKRLE